MVTLHFSWQPGNKPLKTFQDASNVKSIHQRLGWTRCADECTLRNKAVTDVSHSCTLKPTEMPQMFPVNVRRWSEHWEEKQDKLVTWDGLTLVLLQITSSNCPVKEESTCYAGKEMANGCFSPFFSSFSSNSCAIELNWSSRRESRLYCAVCSYEDILDRLTRRAGMCCFQVNVQLCGRAEWEVCGLNSWHRLGL